MPADWQHVADLASLARDGKSEIRLSLLESDQGCAVEIRKFERSRHHEGMNAAGFGLIVFSDRIPELILALEKARTAAAALREAARA